MKIVKVLGAIALLVGGAFGLQWALSTFLSSAVVPDQGNRGLIVFASSGGDREYYLNVRQIYEADGSMALVFYFTAKDITYGANSNTSRIEVSVAFIGTSFEDRVSCGTSSDPVVRQPYASLPAGTQTAVQADLLGGRYSANNYQGKDDPQLRKDAEKQAYSEWRGNLWLLQDPSYYSDRAPDWAEVCHIPASATRRQSNYPDWSQRTTLLPPQIDWTSLGEKTDHQQQMRSHIDIHRASGSILQESYPSLTTLTDGWKYDSDVYWRGRLGELGNMGYSDQPVYIFARRDDSDRRALILLGIGALIGTMGALAVQTLSRVLDLLGSVLVWLASAPPADEAGDAGGPS